MSEPKQLKGKRFGELKVIKRVGTKLHTWAGKDYTVSAYLLQCKKRHREIRGLDSLRVTGKNTKCKACRSRVRLTVLKQKTKVG